jgi:hypothetical protein
VKMSLIERLEQDDVKDLPDWEAAEVLNAPDPSLPIITFWEPTRIGVGQIMTTLGATEGADLLDQLVVAAEQDAVIRWGLKVMEGNGLDLSLQTTREQVSGLVTAGFITEAQKESLFSLSKRERFPSWSEANNTFVDARAVGLARGGI